MSTRVAAFIAAMCVAATLTAAPPNIADHTANANAFAGSTWLVRANERDAMFAEKPAGIIQQETFSALKTAKTRVLDKDDYTSSATAPSSSSPRPGTRPAIRSCS